MNRAQLIRYLKRELWYRTMPHGLFSARYLLPTQDQQVQRHRQLWWHHPRHLPRILWLLLEVWLWLRWVCFTAWRDTYSVVRHLGPGIAAREELPIRIQTWRTMCLAIGWCIPPRDVYRFKLYRNPKLALDYVYGHEIPSYHPWRNRKRGLTQASLKLIQDKQQFAYELSAWGVPVIQEVAYVPRNTNTLLSEYVKPNDLLFCKTRSGSRAEGAFTAWANAEGLQGQELATGTSLENTSAVEAAWKALLKLDDALIQPRLQNHPLLAPLASSEDAITVRFISQWQGDSLNCWCATLEIPVGHAQSNGQPLYCILPIDEESGQLQPFPDDALGSERARAQMQQVWAKIKPDIPMPFWPELSAASYRAHQRFPDIWGIAWDWVITADGPCLLEGNTGWGTVTPQLLKGGLLTSDKQL